MIEEVKRVSKAHSIARDAFQFQMLYDIRRDLQRTLVAEGWRLRLYVPFGWETIPVGDGGVGAKETLALGARVDRN